ncbi:MAG: SUMF1/EgtB/PvdO family nonheme iron enzyme [Planctomycetes bacterium]|nr:SUMF1/EgtB/PvdO family nonheme iron enzyme [Planctomycetota bacterium]
MEQLQVDPQNSLSLIQNKLSELNALEPEDSQLDAHRQRQANLIVASFELGDRVLLSDASKLATDPRLRTYVVHAMHPDRIDLTTFLPLILEGHEDGAMRNVALLAAWHHTGVPLSSTLQDRLTQRLREIHRDDPDAESHSVSGLLLRNLGHEVVADEGDLTKQEFDASRDWYVNDSRQTMVVLRPHCFRVDGYTAPPELSYDFAISSTEVRLDSFRTFNPDHAQDETYQVTNHNVPAAGVLIFRAAKYCNWLSRKEGIREEEWCYPPDSEITVKNCYPVSGFETKSGYRLPLSFEWEYACRAGSTTSRFFGENVRLMNYYGWHKKTSDSLINPVGKLLPNAFGLFDMYGNVAEPCIENSTANRYVTRGESCFRVADEMDSSTTGPADPQGLGRLQGFRVVRRIED